MTEIMANRFRQEKGDLDKDWDLIPTGYINV
jgi:hypothetical protein